MPLQINCTRHELEKGLEESSLPRNVMYWVDKGIRTVEEANLLMERVKAY